MLSNVPEITEGEKANAYLHAIAVQAHGEKLLPDSCRLCAIHIAAEMPDEAELREKAREILTDCNEGRPVFIRDSDGEVWVQRETAIQAVMQALRGARTDAEK